MDTFLLIISVIYAAVTAGLMAIGAGYQLKRWRAGRHRSPARIAAEGADAETVTANPAAAP
jgi:hypothetical protein